MVDYLGNNLWSRQLGAVVCFTFVYFWHGMADRVLIWCILNYAGAVLETAARAINVNPTYRAFEVRYRTFYMQQQ